MFSYIRKEEVQIYGRYPHVVYPIDFLDSGLFCIKKCAKMSAYHS